MRLSVRHRTTYRYPSRARYLAQILRMTPLDGPGQKVLSWSVEADRGRRLPHYVDGFGNLTHLHTLHDWHDEVSISVAGIVETWDTHGVLGMLPEQLPPGFFARTTPLTAPHELVEALAAKVAGETGDLTRLHRLMECAPRRRRLRARRDERGDERRGGAAGGRRGLPGPRARLHRRRTLARASRALRVGLSARGQRCRGCARESRLGGGLGAGARLGGLRPLEWRSRRRSATSGPASGSITPTPPRCAASGAATRAIACASTCTSKRSRRSDPLPAAERGGPFTRTNSESRLDGAAAGVRPDLTHCRGTLGRGDLLMTAPSTPPSRKPSRSTWPAASARVACGSAAARRSSAPRPTRRRRRSSTRATRSAAARTRCFRAACSFRKRPGSTARRSNARASCSRTRPCPPSSRPPSSTPACGSASTCSSGFPAGASACAR